MTQRISNVGTLNLVNATEDSIKEIESIENVGLVLYSKETAHLLTKLNIGNFGSSIEVPEGYSIMNGNLKIDKAFLQSLTEQTNLLVQGKVFFDKDIQAENLKKELQLIVKGKIYVPSHLSGAIHSIIKQGNSKIITYQDSLPRIENGAFTISNSFLRSVEEPQWLVVNGVLRFEKDLEMELFEEKISQLEVNGVISLFQEQEAALYKKISTLTSCQLEVIPTGFEVAKKSLHLNARSIRRFVNKKLYTKKPLIIGSDVTREMLSNAFAEIHSNSFIICHEQVEDLVYELCSLLETEVLAYEHSFRMIEDDEVWSNDQFLALETPTSFIVKGQLTLDPDVQEEVFLEKVSTLDIFGEVLVPEKRLKGSLQKVIRVCSGRVADTTKTNQVAVLQNIGELSL